MWCREAWPDVAAPPEIRESSPSVDFAFSIFYTTNPFEIGQPGSVTAFQSVVLEKYAMWGGQAMGESTGPYSNAMQLASHSNVLHCSWARMPPKGGLPLPSSSSKPGPHSRTPVLHLLQPVLALEQVGLCCSMVSTHQPRSPLATLCIL